MNRRIARLLSQHRHFLIVVGLLTIVMTYPTIVYVFRGDVFWLPVGKSRDAFGYVWKVWHTRQVLLGLDAAFYTTSLFYPQGISLAYFPFALWHALAVNALALVMPLSNAYSLTLLLIVFTSALSGYVYLLWLFKDKWLALFGAVVFGFSPHVIGASFIPDVPWIAPFALVMYCFHRGIKESRTALIFLAGLLTGLTSAVALYHYVCIILMLGIWLCALAPSNWRDVRFWGHIALLAAAIALASAWRLMPMLSGGDSLEASLSWQGQEQDSDLILNFANPQNPFHRPFIDAIFSTTENFYTPYNMSFIGYLPLALIVIGICSRNTRRKMLPWLGLMLVFLVLRLGSMLTVNGVEYSNILLPKFYLNQLLPPVFQAFHSSEHFMAGARMPIAILSCFGLTALVTKGRLNVKPWLVLLLVLVVAVEYCNPIEGRSMSYREFDYLDWLAAEANADDIALVNLPMGRRNAKLYHLFQAVGGFRQVDGIVARMPDSAYDYIRANDILNAWHNDRPMACLADNRARYLASLRDLETDGFTHVALHHNIGDRSKYAAVKESFVNAVPSYEQTSVSIYRLSDLRESCP